MPGALVQWSGLTSFENRRLLCAPTCLSLESRWTFQKQTAISSYRRCPLNSASRAARTARRRRRERNRLLVLRGDFLLAAAIPQVPLDLDHRDGKWPAPLPDDCAESQTFFWLPAAKQVGAGERSRKKSRPASSDEAITRSTVSLPAKRSICSPPVFEYVPAAAAAGPPVWLAP